MGGTGILGSAAIFAIVGFGFLLFTFFGVNQFLSGEHSFRSFTGQ